MILHILSRKIISNTTVAHFCSGSLAVVAGLVMFIGIRRLAAMELTEAEVLMGSLTVMSFAGICLALGFLVRLVMKPATFS